MWQTQSVKGLIRVFDTLNEGCVATKDVMYLTTVYLKGMQKRKGGGGQVLS